MIPLPFSLLVIAEILYSITRTESTSEAVDNAVIAYRFNDIIINQCEHSVEVLTNLTNSITQP